MVSVLVATYNHEKYIRETLDGILNQKTNFKYDVIVHDDASTDHTAEIVKEYEKKYPDIIRGIYQQTNQFYNCNISAKYLYPQIKGKYFAVLDGDDYWIDENKLQMQVDFLEKHPDYSMCMHNAIKFNNETGEKKVLNTFPKDGTLINIPMSKRTWTVCFRSFYATTVITLWLKESGGMENTPSLIQQKGEAWWISLNLRIYIGIF